MNVVEKFIEEVSQFSFDSSVINKINEKNAAEYFKTNYFDRNKKLVLGELKIFQKYLIQLKNLLILVPKIDFGEVWDIGFEEDKNGNIKLVDNYSSVFKNERDKYVFFLLLLINIPINTIHFQNDIATEKIKITITVVNENESITKRLDNIFFFQLEALFQIEQAFCLAMEYELINGSEEAKLILERRIKEIEKNYNKFFEKNLDVVVKS